MGGCLPTLQTDLAAPCDGQVYKNWKIAILLDSWWSDCLCQFYQFQQSEVIFLLNGAALALCLF